MKSILKWFGRVFAFLLLFIVLWLGANWFKVKHFPSIISSFYAKEMCSCLYVMERKEPFCHNYTRQYVPIQNVKVDHKKKIVTVKGLWRTNQARYAGRKQGCIHLKLH